MLCPLSPMFIPNHFHFIPLFSKTLKMSPVAVVSGVTSDQVSGGGWCQLGWVMSRWVTHNTNIHVKIFKHIPHMWDGQSHQDLLKNSSVL